MARNFGVLPCRAHSRVKGHTPRRGLRERGCIDIGIDISIDIGIAVAIAIAIVVVTAFIVFSSLTPLHGTPLHTVGVL